MVKLFKYLLIFALSITVAHAKIEVKLTPSVISLGDSIQLEIISDTEGDPNLEPLKNDFDIINSASSSQFQLINGTFTRNYLWRYTLQPKKAGQLTIPSLTVGNQKTQATQVAVNVNQSTNDDFILISEVDRHRQYVGGEIFYSLKLLYNGEIGGNINRPDLSGYKSIALSQNKRYRTVHNNKHYQVIEWQHIIQPERSGTIELRPAIFNGRVRSNNQFRGLQLKSNAIVIEVLPQPSNWPQSVSWLPAKGVKMWESWEPRSPNWEVGESITREIQIEVLGVLPEQLYDIDVQAPNGIKVYPQTPKREGANLEKGLRSRLIQKWVFIAEKPQDFDLSAVSLTWWNTETEEIEVTTLPLRSVSVTPSSGATNPADVVIGQVSITSSDSLTLDSSLAQEKAFEAPAWLSSKPLIWSLFGLGWLGWLVALVLWRRAPKQPKEAVETKEDPLLTAFNKACTEQNVEQAYHYGLRWWQANKGQIDHEQNELIEHALQQLCQEQTNKIEALNTLKRHIQHHISNPSAAVSKNTPPMLYPVSAH